MSMPFPPPPSAEPRRRPWLLAVLIFAAVVMVGAGGGAVWMLTTSNAAPAGATPKQQAVHACRGFVKDRLKAPATAKFSHEQVTSLGVGMYEVNGYVDSENSFSALIRNQYDCVVEREHGRWTLDSDVTFSEDE